ncbi:hypothetical protein [Pseudomonas sp.]|uniref:hypothetical protein n=1 Tax=Pseudomonas sp. TaxID=306 RepID=UPI0025FFAA43|nr:hypothetical protein [Pseudomonas sp.]
MTSIRPSLAASNSNSWIRSGEGSGRGWSSSFAGARGASFGIEIDLHFPRPIALIAKTFDERSCAGQRNTDFGEIAGDATFFKDRLVAVTGLSACTGFLAIGVILLSVAWSVLGLRKAKR